MESSSCDRCQPRGIGAVRLAISMAKEGAVVIVNYNGSAAKAEDVVKEITEAGGQAGSRSVQCIGLQRGGGVLKGHYQPL